MGICYRGTGVVDGRFVEQMMAVVAIVFLLALCCTLTVWLICERSDRHYWKGRFVDERDGSDERRALWLNASREHAAKVESLENEVNRGCLLRTREESRRVKAESRIAELESQLAAVRVAIGAEVLV